MPEDKRTETGKLRNADLQRLIELSPAVHYVSAVSGDYAAIFISEGVRAQLGYEPEQFTQDPGFWAERIHPDEQEQILAGVEQVFESGRYTPEHRFRHADGSWRWMRDDLTLNRDDDGNPLMIIGSWLDITHRRRSEENLKKSEDRYRSLVENSADWIWEMGLDFQHTYSNRQLEKILGYSTDEFAQLSPHELMHPEDMKYAAARLPSLIAERRGWEGWVVRFRHKDGSYRYLESNAHPILDAAGAVCGFRGVDRDITERIELEREVAATSEHERRRRGDVEALDVARARNREGAVGMFLQFGW